MKNKALIILLAVVSIYHLLLGVLTFLPSQSAISLVNSLFGMSIVASDQLIYIAHLFGIYSIMFALFTGVAATNPIKHKAIINIAIILYPLRLINRVVFASILINAFGVSSYFIASEIILICFFGISLFVLRPKS